MFYIYINTNCLIFKKKYNKYKIRMIKNNFYPHKIFKIAYALQIRIKVKSVKMKKKRKWSICTKSRTNIWTRNIRRLAIVDNATSGHFGNQKPTSFYMPWLWRVRNTGTLSGLHAEQAYSLLLLPPLAGSILLVVFGSK